MQVVGKWQWQAQQWTLLVDVNGCISWISFYFYYISKFFRPNPTWKVYASLWNCTGLIVDTWYDLLIKGREMHKRIPKLQPSLQRLTHFLHAREFWDAVKAHQIVTSRRSIHGSPCFVTESHFCAESECYHQNRGNLRHLVKAKTTNLSNVLISGKLDPQFNHLLWHFIVLGAFFDFQIRIFKK